MDIKELTFKAEERIKNGESLMLVKIDEKELRAQLIPDL